jgi:hypothetical protein
MSELAAYTSLRHPRNICVAARRMSERSHPISVFKFPSDTVLQLCWPTVMATAVSFPARMMRVSGS